MLDDTTLEPLARALRGRLIRRSDPDFDRVRRLYNATIDKSPQIIVSCVDVADVVAAVRFARQKGLDTAIRGGGHGVAGLASVEDGLIIDLSAMRGMRVDPSVGTVRVEGGCLFGDVDHVTHAFGLATVGGVISTTGVAGLTLGGGHGYLTRRYGLTIDNLLAADVVLADGRLVHASSDENPNLFWALRGGGGNFGVVTSFEFLAHPVDRVIGGPLFWPLEELEHAMRWYREWLPGAPWDLYAAFMTGEVPSSAPFPEAVWGEKVCGLFWCNTATEERSERALEQARKVAEPLFEHVGPMPYPALQRLFDPFYPPGLQNYWKGDLFRKLDDAVIAAHAHFGAVPTPLSFMHLYPVDGAVHEVAAAETAWAHRDAVWSMVIGGVDPEPDRVDEITRWARHYWEALHPHSLGASYLNFMMDEGQARVRASYGSNYERLRRIKAAYDPGNFFHVNHNIVPSV